MTEKLTFHFEGALAASHRMNFYESARFQYAAARLMVKLAQFRQDGRFGKKITSGSNLKIDLVSQTRGSFNINIEDPGQTKATDPFMKTSLSDLLAYVSERVVNKIDETTLEELSPRSIGRVSGVRGGTDPSAVLNNLVEAVANDPQLPTTLPTQIQELVKRRASEIYREQRLLENKDNISRIDIARAQKLISMSAPLLSEMATALRTSADTLEVKSSFGASKRTVLFLDRDMAKEIETAIVDQEITPILGDITQFNKDNGWGKLKIDNGAKTVSFNIPSDILPSMKKTLIDKMKIDQVYLQTYFVRDPAGEVIRLIAIGILPTPSI